MRRWEAMRAITRILLSPITDKVKIEKITEILQQGLGVSRCVILTIREENEYEITTAIPFSKEEHGIGEVGTISDKGAIALVVKKKETLLVSDAKTNPLTSYMHHWAVGKGINAILFVPIVIEQEAVAIMVYDATGNKTKFSEDEVEFAIGCAGSIEELLSRETENHRHSQQAQSQERINFSQLLCADIEHCLKPVLISGIGFSRRTNKLVVQLEELLRDRPDLLTITSKIRENIELIQGDITRAENTIRDLTDLARIDHRLNLVETDIGVLIHQTFEELRREKPDIHYLLDINPLPSLMLDGAKFRLALRHILSNAIEEAKKQPEIDRQQVTISSRLRKKGRQAEIVITNFGQIESELLEHIFKPFYSSKSGGTGLGLPIANNLISIQGGTLKIEQEKGKVICRIIFSCRQE